MRLHVIVVEIPEGSWGAGVKQSIPEKISKLIGATRRGQPGWPRRSNLAKRSKRRGWTQSHWEVRRLVSHAMVEHKSKVQPPAPWIISLRLPAQEHLAFYTIVGVMAVVGIMEWPVVVTVAIGHTLVTAQHNKTLKSLGEALEEA